MNFWDLIFPKRCINCLRVGDYICPDCFSFLSFDTSLICIKCKKYSMDGLTHLSCSKNISVDGVIVALNMNRMSLKLLKKFKKDPYISDLKGFIGQLFYESIIQNETFHRLLQDGEWSLYSTPLGRDEVRRRGYSQVELLTLELSQKLDLKITKEIKGNIFLVDDLIKSGETINRHSEFLKKKGVQRVVGLVLIRGK